MTPDGTWAKKKQKKNSKYTSNKFFPKIFSVNLGSSPHADVCSGESFFFRSFDLNELSGDGLEWHQLSPACDEWADSSVIPSGTVTTRLWLQLMSPVQDGSAHMWDVLALF